MLEIILESMTSFKGVGWIFVLGNNNTRVNFGSLIPGISYKLEDTDIIPRQKVHTQNAFCGNADQSIRL